MPQCLFQLFYKASMFTNAYCTLFALFFFGLFTRSFRNFITVLYFIKIIFGLQKLAQMNESAIWAKRPRKNATLVFILVNKVPGGGALMNDKRRI